jgi:formylglycine-generating enzyme required for sulfatase activity
MMARYAGIDTSGYKVFDPMECEDGLLNTSPVGSLKPNAFGVYDIIGNVAEWVGDCYSPTREQPSGACARRFIKGGSWGSLAHNVRIAERIPYPAAHRDDSIGIRVAKTLRR